MQVLSEHDMVECECHNACLKGNQTHDSEFSGEKCTLSVLPPICMLSLVYSNDLPPFIKHTIKLDKRINSFLICPVYVLESGNLDCSFEEIVELLPKQNLLFYGIIINAALPVLFISSLKLHVCTFSMALLLCLENGTLPFSFFHSFIIVSQSVYPVF